jgi:hypothetical protein
VIRAATKEEIALFEEKTNYHPSRMVKAVVNEVEGEIAAMVLFDYWTHSAVQAHIYAPKLRHFVEPTFLNELFSYAFITCGKKLIFSVTPSDCAGSLAISSWLGFKETSRIKDGWDEGVDMVIKQIRYDECRWLQQKVA